jgi:hypothetical protein
MVSSLPLPAGLAVEVEQWEQFSPAAQAVIVQFQGVI